MRFKLAVRTISKQFLLNYHPRKIPVLIPEEMSGFLNFRPRGPEKIVQGGESLLLCPERVDH